MEKIKIETCGLKDVLFPVFMKDNDRKTNTEYSKVVTGIIDGEEWDLNYCSPRYQLVPNSEIFPKIEEIFRNNGISFVASYSHINRVRFYANYRITDTNYQYKVGSSLQDIVSPILFVQHSYNGLTKYQIKFGYYRFICSNGLSIPIEQMKNFNLAIIGKHTEQILKSLETLNELLHRFVNHAPLIISATTAAYNALDSKVVVNLDDRIKEVFEVTKMNLVENKKFNALETVKTLISKEMALLNKPQPTAWLLYNAINQYIYSNRTVVAPEFRSEKDSAVLEYLIMH